MFSNFKDTFIRKPLYISEPPKVVMDAISEDLPDGFKYVYKCDGLCILDAPEGINFDPGTIQLTEEAKSVLPDNPSLEEIKWYSYNSQNDLEILPNKDGCFEINGVQIKAQDIVKAPLKDLTFEDIRLYMKPSPFPKPFEILFSGNGYNITLHMQRTPYKSLHIQRFESVEKFPLSVVYYVDVKKNKFTITFNLCIKNTKSVFDVLSAYEIYNAFIDGNGEIGETKLTNISPSSETKVPKKLIDFWKKMHKIEELFEVSFDIKDGVTENDVRRVEEIYRCFVDKKPFKSYKKYFSVKGKGNPGKLTGDFSNSNEIYIEFSADENYELLGQKIHLKGLFNIFGACIKEQVPLETNGEFKVILDTVKGKKMYESVMYFKEDKELAKFKNDSKHIETMKNADVLVTLDQNLYILS